MNLSKSLFNLRGPRLLLIICGAVVLLGGSALLIWPANKKSFTVYTTLQTQEKMEVQVSMQSKWPWSSPDRLTQLRVMINGKLANVPTQFFSSVVPLDFSRKVMLSDWRGYPEILMWGQKGSSLQEAHWRFMNDSFSELRIKRNHDWKSEFHSEPLPAPDIIVAPPSLPPQPTAVPAPSATVPTKPSPDVPNTPKKNHKEKHK